MSGMKINKGYIPGAIGRIAELHGRYYHQHWEFDSYFEAKVATGLSEFINRYDETRDGFWRATEMGLWKAQLPLTVYMPKVRGHTCAGLSPLTGCGATGLVIG